MSSKTLTALSYLQNYADASEKAQDDLKSCIWQLTKSRRNVRSGIIGVDSTTAYTAELLREELRAQTRVVDAHANGDIDLIDEDSEHPPIANDSSTGCPQWKIYNVLSEMEKTKRGVAPDESPSVECTGNGNPKNDDEEETKGKSLDTTPSSSWTMIQKEDLESDAEEDEKIIRIDPIKMFGGYFTARELKVAQQRALEALNNYTQAANEAAKLLELLKEDKN